MLLNTNIWTRRRSTWRRLKSNYKTKNYKPRSVSEYVDSIFNHVHRKQKVHPTMHYSLYLLSFSFLQNSTYCNTWFGPDVTCCVCSRSLFLCKSAQELSCKKKKKGFVYIQHHSFYLFNQQKLTEITNLFSKSDHGHIILTHLFKQASFFSACKLLLGCRFKFTSLRLWSWLDCRSLWIRAGILLSRCFFLLLPPPPHSRGWGWCLDDAPLKEKLLLNSLLPGVLYSAAHQCRLQYGSGSLLCDDMDVRLWNEEHISISTNATFYPTKGTFLICVLLLSCLQSP